MQKKIALGISSSALREDLTKMLYSNGFITKASPEAKSLLRSIQLEKFDLCIIDQGFVGMDYKSLSIQIEKKFNTPVVFFVQNIEGDFLNFLKTLKLGMYYKKPIKINSLKHWLWNVLEMRDKIFKLENELCEVQKHNLISKAKVILMSKENMTEVEAYNFLRTKSMENRIRIDEYANVLINNN